MYKVTKDGQVLTIATGLPRCKMQPNGVPVLDKDGAGIIVGGRIYNLPGYPAAAVEHTEDDRPVIGDIVADSAAANDIYLALAELGQLVAGGADRG